MSLEKDMRRILESVTGAAIQAGTLAKYSQSRGNERRGGGGGRSSGGVNFDPGTGLVARPQGGGTHVVKGPRSQEGNKPAGYRTETILGRKVKIPYYDMAPQAKKDKDFQNMMNTLRFGSMYDLTGNKKDIGKPAKSPVEFETLQQKTSSAPQNPGSFKGEKEEGADGKVYGWDGEKWNLQESRGGALKPKPKPGKGGGLVKGAAGFVGGQVAFELISQLLGIGQDELQGMIAGGPEKATIQRTPADVLADVRRQEGVSGAKLSQQGPTGKKVRSKVREKVYQGRTRKSYQDKKA